MWQTRLVANLLQQAAPEHKVHQDISGSLAAESLLQIYRNNYFSCMLAALQSTFNKTEVMLGDEFFHHIGHEFILREPYQQASLLNFGATFAHYLAHSDSLANLPYVADLAALEWAMEEVCNMQEPIILGKGDEHRVNPVLRLVPSKFALFDIWQYTGVGQLDVTHQAQWVLVSWVCGDIRLQSFTAEQGYLLQAILDASMAEQKLALSQLPEPTSNWLLAIGLLV